MDSREKNETPPFLFFRNIFLLVSESRNADSGFLIEQLQKTIKKIERRCEDEREDEKEDLEKNEEDWAGTLTSFWSCIRFGLSDLSDAHKKPPMQDGGVFESNF